MEYMTAAYLLIAFVLVTYFVTLWQRTQSARRERAVLEQNENKS